MRDRDEEEEGEKERVLSGSRLWCVQLPGGAPLRGSALADPVRTGPGLWSPTSLSGGLSSTQSSPVRQKNAPVMFVSTFKSLSLCSAQKLPSDLLLLSGADGQNAPSERKKTTDSFPPLLSVL